MRKNQIRKIFKKTLKEFKNKVDNKDKLKYSKAVEPLSNQFNDYMFSDCCESNKSQIRNMIFRLLTLRDTLSISINDERISISSEYGLKPSKNSLNYNSEYFHLDIINKTGYLLNFKEKRVAFKDKYLYSDVVDNIKRIFEELNKKNFEDLYSEVMIESGLARDSNLDDLLDG